MKQLSPVAGRHGAGALWASDCGSRALIACTAILSVSMPIIFPGKQLPTQPLDFLLSDERQVIQVWLAAVARLITSGVETKTCLCSSFVVVSGIISIHLVELTRGVRGVWRLLGTLPSKAFRALL